MVFLDKTTLEGVFNRAARKECIIEPLRRSVLRKSGSIKRRLLVLFGWPYSYFIVYVCTCKNHFD